MQCSSAAKIPGKVTPALVCVCVCAYKVQAHNDFREAQRQQGAMQAGTPASSKKDLSCCDSQNPSTLTHRMQGCPRVDRVCARLSVVSSGVKHLGQKARGVEAPEGNLPVVCIVLNGINCAGHALHGQA